MTVEHVIHRPRPHPSPPPSPTLVSATPTASAPASVAIGHVQLRDLIVCPVERGVLWYVGDRSIIEQDILAASPRQRTLALLPFTPVTLAALPLPSSSSSPPSDDVRVLLAAGGQDADLFLALYSYTPHRTKRSTRASGSLLPPEEALKGDDAHGGRSTPIWQHTSSLIGSINNNVLLYLPPGADPFDVPEEDPEEDPEDTSHTQTRASPRLIVSNNDCTVKFFDVCLARGGLRRAPASPLQAARALDARYWRRAGREGGGWGERGERSAERLVRYERVGLLRLPVPVNHTSISPDGSTLLSCGDAATIYLHRILPVRDGTTLLFEPLAQYEMPIPAPSSSLPPPSPPLASSSSFTRHASPPSSYLPFAFVDGAWVVAAPFSASHPFPPFYSNNDNSGGGSADSGAAAPPACFATAWSADGTRFAAASQEGAVRVWDVRSGAPLAGAQWETARTGPPDFSPERNAGAGTGASARWLEQTGAAPPWSVRALRFARTPGGREVLVFTEHVERVHVIDADTFETHDVLRVPHGQPGAPVPRPRAEEGAYAPYPSASSSSAFAFPDHGYGYDHDAAFSLAFPYPGYLDAYFDGEGEDAGDDSALLSTLRDRYEARERRRARREILLSDARSAGLGLGMGMDTGMDTETRTDMERVAFMGSPTMPPPRRVLSPYRPFTRSPDEMDVDADTPPPPASSQPADAAQVQAQRQRVASALARARVRARTLERARERVEDARMEADIAFHARRGEREREEGALVIPPLARASAEEEADVRRVLRAHGIATQGGNGEDREDIECVEEPAEGPSNAGRPEPFAGPYADEGAGTSTPPSASTSANTIATFFSASPRGPSHASPPAPPPPRAPTSTPPGSSSPSAPPGSSPSAPHAPDTAPALPPCAELIAATARVDVAGVALDPCGAYVYVASAEGVTEWAVRGAGRRWWRAGGWM